MTDPQRLELLFHAHHPCISIVTYEEDYALDTTREAAEQVKKPLWVWSVIQGVRDGLRSDGLAIKDTEHPAAALYHFAYRENRSVCVMLDLADHLKDARTLRVLREAIDQFREAGGHLVLIDCRDEFPAVLGVHATRFEPSLPDERELETIAVETLRRFNRENPIEVSLTRGDLKTVIRNLSGLTRRQAEQIIIDAVADDRRFQASDINKVLAGKREMLYRGGLLQYVEAPTDLSEIGGLSRLKTWLRQRQNALTDEAAAFGIEAPRGVLMLGVQGAGKSLCAKAIATAWQRPLLRMDVGALYDRYIGESERRLRDALQQAEMMAPNILWIDEIEKAFASAASRNTDGGLSQRMFGSLLTWMQEHAAPVFLVATANDIEALPPELLRKGRFDEIFFVDLPTEATRRDIFAIHLRKRHRKAETFDLGALAEASEGYSGAEIEQAVISALFDVFEGKTDLTTEAVLNSINSTVPLSTTMKEDIDGLRQWAEGRARRASAEASEPVPTMGGRRIEL